MLLSELPPKLGHSIGRRIEFSVQPPAQRSQASGDFSSGQIADDHQVHVTGLSLFATGNGAVDEGHSNPIRDAPQRGAKRVTKPYRLEEQGLKLSVDWIRRVDTVVSSITPRDLTDQACCHEPLQSCLDHKQSQAGDVRQFSLVEITRRTEEEDPQKGEERVAREKVDDGRMLEATNQPSLSTSLLGYTTNRLGHVPDTTNILEFA